MSKTKELEPEVQIPNGVAHGYRPRVGTRRIVAVESAVLSPITKGIVKNMTPEEGSEPFWADVRDDLTFADIDSLDPKKPFADVWAIINPWVIAWNAMGQDRDTGEWVPVPPPAEIGEDAFKSQRTQVTLFIAWCIRLGDGLPDLPKGLSTSSGMDDGSPAAS
jgi:hypothetical protein